MARPKGIIEYTDEIGERIVAFVRAGNYIETAAAAAGISKQSLYNWLKRGARKQDAGCERFLDAIEVALAESESRDVMLISRAAQDDWKAAAWRLERRFPRKWAKVEVQLNRLLRERERSDSRTGEGE